MKNRQIICVLLTALWLLPWAVVADEPTLVLNALNEEILPKKFRSCRDSLPTDYRGSKDGLAELRISGSAQFSDRELNALQKKLGSVGKLTIVDLRAECHGFVNGMAVSWFSTKNWAPKGKTPQEIEQNEDKKLAGLLAQKEIVVTRMLSKTPEDAIKDFVKMNVQVTSVSNEAKLIKQHGLGLDYKRIYVLDHTAPSEEQAEEFIKFFKALGPDNWLHIHCAAGSGRTTLFMCMCDMLRNASKLSFEDIVQRQYRLGGIDLQHLGAPDGWKYPCTKQRLEFLKRFYEKAKAKSS